MPAHAFVLQVMALILVMSGVQKIREPTSVVRALAGAGLPSQRVFGRLLGVAETAIGAWVLASGGLWSAAALVMLYGGFIVFIVSNRLRGLHVPCGCLGESTQPPGVGHVIADAIGVGVGTIAVARPVGSALEWMDNGSTGAMALVAVVIAAAAVIMALDRAGRIARDTP